MGESPTRLAQPSVDIHTALQAIRNRLAPTSDTPGLDAQVLLADLLGRPRAWVLAHHEASLTLDQSRRLEERLTRLERGLPLPYELGHWEFFGLDFLVTPDVLIPRPETELLVEHALAWLRSRKGAPCIVDVGTGSGCIAVALAVKAPDARLLASDISIAAVRLARENARRHGASQRVAFLACDLLPPVQARFDLICANLPYIPQASLAALPVAHREPLLALDGGLDGLSTIRRLLSGAGGVLSAGGLLLLEIEASQGERALELARRSFPEADVRLFTDLAKRDRLVSVQIH